MDFMDTFIEKENYNNYNLLGTKAFIQGCDYSLAKSL